MDKDVRSASARVLLVGLSGDGDALPPAAIRDYELLIVIEGDRQLIDRARQQLDLAGTLTKATLINADPARMLHKLSGPFDCIVLARPDETLGPRLKRLLAPAGHIVNAAGEPIRAD